MFTLSMSELFPACISVLKDLMRPIHYSLLTKLAIEKIGYSIEYFSLGRLKEDVREKLLQARSKGTFYISSPPLYFHGGLQSWFHTRTDTLLQVDQVCLPIKSSWSIAGSRDALLRSPHMIIKTEASPVSIMDGRARGKFIEANVSGWFKENYPDLWLPPSNEWKYEKVSPEDFSIRTNGKVFKIDVFGPTIRGSYEKASQKFLTDLHLLCRPSEYGILFEGVIPGSFFREQVEVYPEICFSPVNFLVWLNCLKYDLPWNLFRKKAINNHS